MTTFKVIAVTQPLVRKDTLEVALANDDPYLTDYENPYLTADEFIAYVARVSNPSNQYNTLTAPKLLKYLIKNRHWSPFEQVFLTAEINTTRDIAHQIVRHRSFAFQEFSQRYADPTKDMGFTISEARLQDAKNRQNSIETDDVALHRRWELLQQATVDNAIQTYDWAIKQGLAKEVARKVLPEGLTNTRLYMSGSLRSWIHYIDVRAEQGTQKEHRIVAETAKTEIIQHFPSLEEYWQPPVVEVDLKKPWWRVW